MKTLKKINLFIEFVHFIPENELLHEQTLYISDEFNVGVHLCLCGCKNLVVTPFNKSGWNKEFDEENKISITPSIGNFNFPCKSHYIITNNVANVVGPAKCFWSNE